MLCQGDNYHHIHPFREGNGRTLRAFLKGLARQAGYDLDLRRIRSGEWIDASIRTHAPAAARSIAPSDYEAMTAVIAQAITRDSHA